jgi:DNA adenine methylase
MTQSNSVKPFIKWAGGKSSLLSQYAPHIPQTFDRYHEPFLGGGAMFFHLCPDRAILSDTNHQLINTYKHVRDNLEGLIEHLQGLQRHHDQCVYGQGKDAFYYEVRRNFNGDSSVSIEQAARMIYLNKTCFNGLYRENSKGEMNVPKGDTKSPPVICDTETLTACSIALNKPGVTIMVEGYDRALDRVSSDSNSFVFCDPPYMPIASQKSNFNAYQAGGFGLEDQEALEKRLWHLSQQRVTIMVSNASSARELYSRWEANEVLTRRSIAANEGDRSPIIELLFKRR